MGAEMRALTLWQPWSWAIARAGKRVENREWKPPAWIIGERIAIHAGKKYDDEAAVDLYNCGLDVPTKSKIVLGAIECTAIVKGWIAEIKKDHPQSFWFCGPIGWVFGDVIVLPEPIPCRGRQKLWDVPHEIVGAILKDQLKYIGKPYTWDASQDERVRPEHKALNGKII